MSHRFSTHVLAIPHLNLKKRTGLQKGFDDSCWYLIWDMLPALFQNQWAPWYSYNYNRRPKLGWLYRSYLLVRRGKRKGWEKKSIEEKAGETNSLFYSDTKRCLLVIAEEEVIWAPQLPYTQSVTSYFILHWNHFISLCILMSHSLSNFHQVQTKIVARRILWKVILQKCFHYKRVLSCLLFSM